MKDLIRQLVSFKTYIPDEINKAMDWIEDYLQGYGIPIKKFDNGGLSMLTAEIGNPKGKKLILNAHVDVVENPPEHFRLTEDGTRLIGPGVVDMKGSVAAYMSLLAELKGEKLPIALQVQFVPDEEVGGMLGTNYLVKKGFLGDFVICGEPTHLNISVQSKGRIYLEAEAKGRTSHSARPWEGDNAIFKAFEFYNKIKDADFMKAKNKFFNSPSLSMTRINAGTATNKVPDRCTAGIDIRYLPEQDEKEILREIETLGVLFEIKSRADPMLASETSPWVKGLLSITKKHKKDARLIGQHGSADGRFFTPHGIEAIEFGPSGGNQHGYNEYLDYQSLENYKKILKEFILAL